MGDSFFYQGEISSSKSLYNRALIAQSFYPHLKIKSHFSGESLSKDIQDMKEACAQMTESPLYEQSSFFCGDGGTVLRFLAFRLSRLIGEYQITGTPRLLSRPHGVLMGMLEELGVQCSLQNQTISLRSQGWKTPERALLIDLSYSSQFLSGLLLSAWGLDFDLEVRWEGRSVSQGYLQMTLDFLKELGMDIHVRENGLFVPRGQDLKKTEIFIEGDMSSSWAVAAAAALCGEVHLEHFSFNSQQPDARFVEILEKMGVSLNKNRDEKKISIYQTRELLPVDVNLQDSPDLFPVLSVICSFAAGQSTLYGAEHLKHKESSRIDKIFELLSKVGIQCEPQSDGLIIYGQQKSSRDLSSWLSSFEEEVIYDCDSDHRLVMAAAIFQKIGVPLKLIGQEAIEKSFPEFFTILNSEAKECLG